MKKTLHCQVEGRVQGVFFRKETQQQAAALGLTGWVRNLPDGRVEVLASGEEQALLQLGVWLEKGPTLARVTKLDQECLEYQPFDSFTIRYD